MNVLKMRTCINVFVVVALQRKYVIQENKYYILVVLYARIESFQTFD